jgi:hypothetical protein
MAAEYAFPALPQNTAGFIVSEAPGYQSRTQGVVAAGSGMLKAGTVMGQLTANGQYGPYTPGAANGLQNAVALLYDDCDATSAAVGRTLFDRNLEYHRAEIVFAGTPTTPQMTTAYAALEARGMKGR